MLLVVVITRMLCICSVACLDKCWSILM